MDKNNISIKMPMGTFNYRVGAIIINENKILMVQNSGSPHYYTVGGRVCFGETIQEAVLREVREELQVSLEIDKLVYMHENFFNWGSDQIPCHEINFFYLMQNNSSIAKKHFVTLQETYGEVSFHWLPIDNLFEYHIFPEFFKSELKFLSQGEIQNIQNFVTKNGTTIRLS